MPHKPTLSCFPFTTTITTRWSDNDQYGHLNNAIYYQLYDALVNSYMIHFCKWHPTDPRTQQIGLVVSSGTEFYEIIDGFPEPLILGLGVKKLGKNSVEYEIGLFQGRDAETQPAKAIGRFVHVFVDRKTHKTSPNGMNIDMREGLEPLIIKDSNGRPKL